jgi:hypothetical protein
VVVTASVVTTGTVVVGDKVGAAVVVA